MIRHLHNSQNDHPNKSSAHLTSYIVIKILLTIFPMLYFIFPWIFCNYQFVLLNPSPFSLICQTPTHLATVMIFPKLDSVFVLFVHLFCFLNSTRKWNHMAFVFLSLISFSTVPSRLIHVFADGKILFFFMAETYSIACMHHFFSIH